MKKRSLIAALIPISISATSLLTFSSCSEKTYEFIVKTNFSKDEAEMDQTHGFAKQDFDSNITIKKNLKIHHFDVLVDGIKLTPDEDFTCITTSENLMHLHVNGTSIHIDDLEFNIYFESFEAVFSSDDNITSIDNTLVTYDNDFVTRIYLRPWSDISFFKVANSLTTFYRGSDYRINKEGNVVLLTVFKHALHYSNLFISISTTSAQFDPTFAYTSFSNFEHSDNRVSFDNDFDITFLWKVSNLRFISITVSNSIRTFVENEDYVCYWLNNALRIHIPKKSIVYNKLHFTINAITSDINPVGINAFDIDYVEDSHGRFFPKLINFYSQNVLEENNVLQIPDCVVTISNSVFSGKLDTKQIQCANVKKLIFSKKLTTIGESAFAKCDVFEGELVIPFSIKEIGKSAFQNCSGFTSLRFADDGYGSTDVKVGDNCFQECTGIQEIDFSNFNKIPDFLKTDGKKQTNMFDKISETGKVYIKEGLLVDDWKKALKDNGLPEKWTFVSK